MILLIRSLGNFAQTNVWNYQCCMKIDPIGVIEKDRILSILEVKISDLYHKSSISQKACKSID